MTIHRQHLSVFVVVVALGLWSWFGFRVLAYNTGQLGPLTVHWQNFQEPHQLLALDPQPTTPTITLEPGSAYTIFMKKPWHFRTLRVTASATGALQLTSMMADGSLMTTTDVTSRLAFTDLLTQQGVYRIRIENTGTRVITLNRVQLMLWP